MNDLDARVKLLSVILLTVLLFFIDKIPIIVCMTLSLILIRILLKIPFRNIKFLKNLLLLAAFIILMHSLFGYGNTYIFPPFFGSAVGFKFEGLFLGLVIACRLISLMMIFPILSETTAGSRLAAAFASLGVQYRTAFIITSAFNQVPRFSEEARIIMDAQELRGADIFEKKRPLQAGGRLAAGKIKFKSCTVRRGVSVISWTKIIAYAKICIPLILNAMRKAKTSSVAMDSRAFGVYKTRTWIDKPKIKTRDFLFISGCIIFCTLILFFNFYFA